MRLLNIIKQAHLTATSLIEALEKKRKNRRLLLAIWEFFNGEDYSSDDISIDERRRVPVYLANAQQQLIEIFEVNVSLRNTRYPFASSINMFKTICRSMWKIYLK